MTGQLRSTTAAAAVPEPVCFKAAESGDAPPVDGLPSFGEVLLRVLVSDATPTDPAPTASKIKPRRDHPADRAGARDALPDAALLGGGGAMVSAPVPLLRGTGPGSLCADVSTSLRTSAAIDTDQPGDLASGRRVLASTAPWLPSGLEARTGLRHDTAWPPGFHRQVRDQAQAATDTAQPGSDAWALTEAVGAEIEGTAAQDAADHVALTAVAAAPLAVSSAAAQEVLPQLDAGALSANLASGTGVVPQSNRVQRDRVALAPAWTDATPPVTAAEPQRQGDKAAPVRSADSALLQSTAAGDPEAFSRPASPASPQTDRTSTDRLAGTRPQTTDAALPMAPGGSAAALAPEEPMPRHDGNVSVAGLEATFVLPHVSQAGVHSPDRAAIAVSPLPESARVAPEVGSSDWGRALGQQVVHLGREGQKSVELQINPPGLGPLKLSLALHDHQMQLQFVSEHASVRAALESAVPQLRATLADNGIQLGQATVGSQGQPASTGSQQQGGGSSAQPRHPEVLDTAMPLPRAQRAAVRTASGSGVDTFA